MSQSVHIPSNNDTSKITENSDGKVCKQLENNRLRGRYIAPKIYSGFFNQEIKFKLTNRLCSKSKLSPVRSTERFSKEQNATKTQFAQENIRHDDSKNEEISNQVADVTCNDTNKNDSSIELETKLPLNKLQPKIYRSSSLTCVIQSKSMKNNYRSYRNDQYTRTQASLCEKCSPRPIEKIFRASSIYLDKTTIPANPFDLNGALKSVRV